MAVSEWLKGKKTGIVLSGGGAKGAYQIGMFHALEKAGLEKAGLELAGTSIGALNSLLYAIRGADAIWDLMHAGQKLLEGIHRSAGTPDNNEAVGVLMDVMRKIYPDRLLEENVIPVTVCAYCHETEKPEYFRLNGLPPKEQRILILASAALPDLSKPVPYHGHHYTDGGVVPKTASASAAPADKIPLTAFRDSEADPVFVSYLMTTDHVDPGLIGERKLIEIRPKAPLEKKLHAGTLDFSEATLQTLAERGYAETLELLEKLDPQ